MTSEKINILIVEDEEGIRNALMIDLEFTGHYKCTGAPDRSEALEILKKGFTPELFLVDIMMPSSSKAGIELIADLKANPMWKPIPVIVLSARMQSEIILEALKSGAIDYLVKPYDSADLLRRVQRAIDLKKPKEEEPMTLRQLHLETMRTAVLFWELKTQKSKSELAFESKIWSHYFDEKGTLRSKTLDRYLSDKTLPKKPKSHLVINTARFVLEKCGEEDKLKPQLQQLLDQLESALLTKR